jgi:hypothetical protein
MHATFTLVAMLASSRAPRAPRSLRGMLPRPVGGAAGAPAPRHMRAASPVPTPVQPASAG